MQQHHKKSTGKTTRDRNDQYETPEEDIQVVIRELLALGLTGPVLEPACGSGCMVREIQRLTGLKVSGFDIQQGHDFLKRTEIWKGSMITNPPYHKKLPIQFALKAHEIVDGRFAMLLQGGFLWTTGRADNLRGILKPEKIIIVPWRIYFYRADGKRIKGQAYSHCWIIWPERKNRGKIKKTEIVIAEKP